MVFSKFKNRFTRECQGVACIEIGIATFLMIVLAAFGLDLSLIIFGMDLNDSACRDAARSAAQQSTQAKALQAAQSQLSTHATDGFWVSQPILKSAAAPDFVYNDFQGNPPANISPYVTVTSLVSIRCPAPILFFGASFIKSGKIQFARKYTFPIVKQKFYG
ncbi:MAG: hypothetical protein JST89_20055 [Cyanobacteria bacterium SZAS-4]|nr:hypothetical protein [Cyanobacteria bacterium SZAS-4]